jgi:hypothetical protein
MKRILAILLATAVVLTLTLTSSALALGDVDATPPSVAIISPPSGFALQDGVTFVASATDSGSGVASVTFSIREDSGVGGIPIGYEDIPAIQDPATGNWSLWFDTLQLPGGYYVVVVKATDNAGNPNSITVPYSIRNWVVVDPFPATPATAGSTIPVGFSLRIAAPVDPAQPFVYEDDLTIKIYATSTPGDILQTSVFGTGPQDYQIDGPGEEYVTHFNTSPVPMQYTVEIWRTDKHFLVGSFTFKTAQGAIMVSCDSAGNPREQFAPGESVYVKGTGLEPSTHYLLWIQDDPVADGDALIASEDPVGQALVITDSNGDFGPANIWNIPADAPVIYHSYDIVADKQDDGENTGKYNSGSDAIDSLATVGFTAPVPELPTVLFLGAGLVGVAGVMGLRLLRRRRPA